MIVPTPVEMLAVMARDDATHWLMSVGTEERIETEGAGVLPENSSAPIS